MVGVDAVSKELKLGFGAQMADRTVVSNAVTIDGHLDTFSCCWNANDDADSS
jgi:hypothetical protein